MTALAVDVDQGHAAQSHAPSAKSYHAVRAALDAENPDCNRYLVLQIALLAPVSAALWATIGWSAYRLLALLTG